MNIRNFFLCTFLLIASSHAIAQHTVSNLKCEYLIEPIGVDKMNPRLSWSIQSSEKNIKQTDYTIIIGTDSLQVANNKGSVWNSGKLVGDSILISYAGKKLEPSTKYFWKVLSWVSKSRIQPGNQVGTHAKNESPNPSIQISSKVSSFETGLMNSGWRSAWITDGIDINQKPAGYFRKEFELKKNIRSARAYIAVAGLFEFYINSERIGDHQLDPMYTRFDRRNLYVTHDITNSVRDGKNVFGIVLGNGWYNHQSTAVWFFDKATWRARPKFCIDIKIEYVDGSIEWMGTDNSWKCSEGSIVFNSIYTAEHKDARKEQKGWNTPGFDDSKWKGVVYTSAPSQNIVSQQLHPIRYTDTIQAVSMRKFSDTVFLFDLGRNISGVSGITINGKSGAVIRMVHGERLDSSGRVDLSNIDLHYRPTDLTDPFQTDIFVLSGEGEEAFKPSFNYKGFQYVQVHSSTPVELQQNSLKGYFMHSDVPPIGKINSSNPLINKIWEATNNSYLSNLFGYPTDCPQREKNGWTGDAHIASETGLYNFDAITVYEKWMGDHKDEQQENGVFPSIIPTNQWGYDWGNGPDWTSTIAIIPWNIYQFYGDKTMLEETYENLKKYVDYINLKFPDGLTDWGLGDWIPIKSVANKELTSSAYYFVDADILSKSAGLLGKQDDEKKYRALADKIFKAFNEKFYNKEKAIYASGFQTELAVPLHWGLVPEEYKKAVAESLFEKVVLDKGMDVGLLGSKALLNALSDNGYAQLAYDLASRDTYPSWGYWIKNGATTLFENWRIIGNSDLSLNHIMFGEIGAWFYKALGGIKVDPSHPGFKNVIIQPNFVKGLDHFESSFDGPYGKIISSWKRKGKGIELKVTVPANSIATIILKDKKIEAGSGEYVYVIPQ